MPGAGVSAQVALTMFADAHGRAFGAVCWIGMRFLATVGRMLQRMLYNSASFVLAGAVARSEISGAQT
jgi:hypothetical protein